MFHLVCDELSTWLQRSCGVKNFVWSMPTDPVSSIATVWCHLHSIAPDGHGAHAPRLDLHFRLGFVASVTANTPRRQQELLGKLAIAISEEPAAHWITAPLHPNPWQGLDYPAAASIQFSMPATWQRPLEQAPLVQQAEIRQSDFRSISGTLYGPDQQIMAHETISLPQFKTSTHSDAHGQFNFARVPINHGRQLQLQVRQQSWELPINHKPLILRYLATEN